MMRTTIRKIWKWLPSGLRLRLARAGSARFTFSAAVIICNREGKYLLLNHLLRPYSGWGLPGGFIKRGEQPEDAIRRELREEIGIELDNVRLYKIRAVGKHVEVLFTAEALGKPEICSFEISDWEWFAAAALPAEMSENHKRLIANFDESIV